MKKCGMRFAGWFFLCFFDRLEIYRHSRAKTRYQTMRSRKYMGIHVTTVFTLTVQVPFSKKKFFISLGECMYQISGLYCFSFAQGSGTNTDTDIRTNIDRKKPLHLRQVDLIDNYHWNR